MLDFQPISSDNIGRIREACKNQPYRACDYTAGEEWQWRGWLASKVAFVGACAVLSGNYSGEGTWYLFPVGGDNCEIAMALREIEKDAAERKIPLRFCVVPEEALAVLQTRYGERLRYSPDRDAADYLYNSGDLKLFPGKHFHGQKNHLNHFLKDHPFSYFEPVTEKTLPEARAFLATYAGQASLEKNIERDEMQSAQELLEQVDTLGLKAGFLRADEEHICALSIGETVGDTLYVHVEKADVAHYPGAYQAIVSAFAQYAADENILWCNREDDSGDEGLRQSKESYHPVRLINKYWVTVES